MLGSNHHLELNPSDCGNKDTLVVQEVIKDIAQHGTLGESEKSFKVVVLTEVDQLSKSAQAALRRTMEKYTSSCRLILCCERPSKVIDPVRSRCLGIRVPLPKQSEVIDALQRVAKAEKITLPAELAGRIAEASKRNVRRAILMLEACRVKQYPLHPTNVVDIADWERFTLSIARDMLTEQSPQQLLKVRGKLYELLTNCIPADMIIKQLVSALMSSIDHSLAVDVIKWAAFYEHRLHLGQKDIIHLEAFVAKFMALYKNFISAFFG